MLYICAKFCQSISYGFRVTDLNSRVNARVVTNVDGQTDAQTDVCTNGQKTGSLYSARPKADATKKKGNVPPAVNSFH